MHKTISCSDVTSLYSVPRCRTARNNRTALLACRPAAGFAHDATRHMVLKSAPALLAPSWAPACQRVRLQSRRQGIMQQSAAATRSGEFSPVTGVECQQWHSQGACWDGECENLHLEEIEAQSQAVLMQNTPSPGRLIIAAGPERSGSTWLFNAIRFLYQEAGQALHPYWLHSISERKLQQRHCGQPGAPVVLIKTHRWSTAWDPAAHPDAKIFLTHRDLGGVVGSYRRVGWAFDIPASYVEEHQRWRDLAAKDVAFEDILSQPQKELEELAVVLDLTQRVNVRAVHRKLQALKPPVSGPPDPVSKLWARHLSPEVLAKQAGSGAPLDSSNTASDAQLRRRFPEYYRQYGY